MSSVDGFYAAYLTGKSSQGFAMFILRKGRIVGYDATGAAFNGQYEDPGDQPTCKGWVKVKLPPGEETIQGIQTGNSGIEYDVQLELPTKMASDAIVRLETTLGPVNARFVKVGELDV